jgi:hypothetical protein
MCREKGWGLLLGDNALIDLAMAPHPVEIK